MKNLLHILCGFLLICFIVIPLIRPGVWANDFPPIDEIREVLRKYAHVPPDEELLQELKPEGLKESIQQIDQYASLFKPGKYEAPSLIKNILVGIGAELFFREDRAFLFPYQNGPMALAGFMERVELTAVDGVPIHGLKPEMVAQKLTGEVGTSVELSLLTLSKNMPIQIQLRRAYFSPMHVELLLNGNQAVIRLRNFKAGLTSSAIRASVEYIGPKIRPLFIDLRESIGGDIYEAFDCAALFLPEGSRLGGIRLHGLPDVFFPSPKGKKLLGPLVLIVGPNTASAGEAFAAALRYHAQALLIGETTYGKCSTQTDVHLSGQWVLRMTNGFVLMPNGHSCNGVGLQPDILIDETDLYNLSELINHVGPEALKPKAIQEKLKSRHFLGSTHEVHLTLGVLLLWDRLPNRYIQLSHDLLHDMKMLDLNFAQVRKWSIEASNQKDSPL